MSIEILEEIEETWSTEGKDELMSRYFFHRRDIDKLKKGNKFFVIGRKGSGKTAIAKYLNTEQSYNQFSIKLDFKSFPFNELYQLFDKGFTVPNQYITIWKYVIYSNIVKLMIKNENIDTDMRTKLEAVYSLDPAGLSRMIKKWTGADFKLPWFGFGGKREEYENNLTWIDKVEILENIIKNYIDDSKYIVIFDELDEDYKDVLVKKTNKDYLSLIISLFKAIQDIKSIFEDKKKVIMPIVFLRDDIYEIIMDNDKNKWNNNIIYISWELEKIKEMLAYRISKTIDKDCTDTLEFDTAWIKLFENKKIGYGNRQSKQATAIKHISRLTHLRPRDFIFYIITCVESSLENEEYPIKIKTIRQADKAFSNYFKRELQDEVFAILPNIVKIFNILTQYKKQFFKLEDFKDFYENHLMYSELTKEEQDINFVFKIFFHFSIIGNISNNNRIFKYLNQEATINYNHVLTLHRGLFKSLKVN